jgi:hypothetical protein
MEMLKRIWRLSGESRIFNEKSLTLNIWGKFVKKLPIFPQTKIKSVTRAVYGKPLSREVKIYIYILRCVYMAK